MKIKPLKKVRSQPKHSKPALGSRPAGWHRLSRTGSASPGGILSKLLILILFAVLATALFIARSGFHAQAALPSDPEHVVPIPYYSIQDDWDSTLTLNNAAHAPLTASVTLYSLEGNALQLRDVALQPSETVALRLSELIPQSSNHDRFQEGSVEIRFNKSDPMALVPQLTVSDSRHGLSFDLEPPMGLKSSSLEGLWWSPDEQTSGRVMLSNTTANNLSAQLDLEWHGVVIPATAISLSPHQTFVLEVGKLLKDMRISAKGIERGGLSIHHSGAPGALIAQGVILNRDRHFSSNLNFVDPAGQKNSVLNGAGLMLAHPVAGSAFPESSFFTPRLTLKNASKSSQMATVTVNYTGNGRSDAKTLPKISLAPHEVRAVDFTKFVAVLRNVSISSAGMKIEATGAPGTLIATLSSIEEVRNTVVDVPLVSRSERSGEGGNHPFRLDEASRSVAYITNITPKATTLLVAVFYPGGMFTPELISVGPGATIAVDLLQLRDGQVKDVQGRTLPPGLSTGQVFWRPHQGEALIGRVVTLDKDANTTSSFGCPNCCGFEPSRYTASPDPFTGPVGGSQQMTLYEYDSMCGQFTMGPYAATGIRSYASDNPSVATINSTSTVRFLSAGHANIVYQIEYYHSDNISAEDCGTSLAMTEVACPVAATPVINSISPARSLIGKAVQVMISGRGFGTGPVVIVRRNGVSAVITSKSDTQLTVSFDVSANADTGNHNVSVTANDMDSNKVGFFVQVPASLMVLSSGIATRFPNALRNGCPPSQPFGMEIAVTYQVMDQDDPPQPIRATMTLRENLLNPTIDGQRAGDDAMEVIVTASGTTEANGSFLDNGVGANGPAPFGTGQLTQQLIIVMSPTNKIFVRIHTWTFTGRRGCGSMSNNRDVSINVTC